MTAPAAAFPAPRVLADLIPGSGSRAASAAREAVLVGGGAALTGASAQIAITIPQITPVPFVLTTFTVLLLGAAYGPLRAGATMLVYLAAGVAGVPWFTEGGSGAGFPSFGYILGFLAAAVLVGWLAKRGADRSFLNTVGLMVMANLVIYAFGAPYLAWSLGLDVATTIEQGVSPFMIGDFIKLFAAAALLPAAWWAVGRLRRQD